VSALLLGAIVAPTDPVLASDVQIRRVTERDSVRFGLTAEGGMNDGLAAAGILGALALSGASPSLGRAILVDIAWSLPAGFAIGWACGSLIGRFALALHRRQGATEGFEVFLLLGLIALTYGAASLLHAEGFLAVFAAAVALRRIERRATARAGGDAVAPAGNAPATIAHQLLAFNRQVERIAEVVVVILAGALLATVELDLRVLGFALAASCLPARSRWRWRSHARQYRHASGIAGGSACAHQVALLAGVRPEPRRHAGGHGGADRGYARSRRRIDRSARRPATPGGRYMCAGGGRRASSAMGRPLAIRQEERRIVVASGVAVADRRQRVPPGTPMGRMRGARLAPGRWGGMRRTRPERRNGRACPVAAPLQSGTSSGATRRLPARNRHGAASASHS
jgi:hypothetical protein